MPFAANCIAFISYNTIIIEIFKNYTKQPLIVVKISSGASSICPINNKRQSAEFSFSFVCQEELSFIFFFHKNTIRADGFRDSWILEKKDIIQGCHIFFI